MRTGRPRKDSKGNLCLDCEEENRVEGHAYCNRCRNERASLKHMAVIQQIQYRHIIMSCMKCRRQFRGDPKVNRRCQWCRRERD